MAKYALSMLPDNVLQLQKEASNSQRRMVEAVSHVHAHMVRVAKMSVSSADKPHVAPVRPMDHIPEVNWNLVVKAGEDHG